MELTPLQVAAVDQDRAMTEDALSELVAAAANWRGDDALLLVQQTTLLRAAQRVSADHVALLAAVAILRLAQLERAK